MNYNYKNSHSIVLLAICDAKYVFRFVDIGAVGRRSDGGILKTSKFGQKLENNELNIPKPKLISRRRRPLPHCIVGDQAFPLKPYMLRPYPGKKVNDMKKRIYNYRLSRARRVIENSFGILASKWRVFRKSVIASQENVSKIVKATICLHNWLRLEDISNKPAAPYVTPDLIDRETADGRTVPGTWRQAEDVAFVDINRMGTNNSTREAIQIREEFCEYFNNEGAVKWQDDYA